MSGLSALTWFLCDRSKGYGFVRFGDENERSRALTEMNGALFYDRQMRVNIATPKRAVTNQQQHSSQGVRKGDVLRKKVISVGKEHASHCAKVLGKLMF